MLANINSIGPSFGKSFGEHIFNKISNKEIKNPERFNRMGTILASPHWNRVAIGIAALTTQPVLDKLNPKVDSDTANVSAIRTGSKNLICMTSGFVIRGTVYKVTEKFAHGSESEGSTLLTPKVILKEANKDIRNAKLKIFKNAYSTIAALCVMAYTNIVVDARLVTFCSNKAIEFYNSYKNKKNMIHLQATNKSYLQEDLYA